MLVEFAMKDLIESGSMDCTLFWNEEMNRKYWHTVDYADYLPIMALSKFVPCPAGNNPETFRHYEALEVGAIPLIVRQKNSEIDFLKYLNGYPGPILNSWSEAEEVMRTLEETPGALDAMQNDIRSWYII